MMFCLGPAIGSGRFLSREFAYFIICKKMELAVFNYTVYLADHMDESHSLRGPRFVVKN
jgi:hypothetical protein